MKYPVHYDINQLKEILLNLLKGDAAFSRYDFDRPKGILMVRLNTTNGTPFFDMIKAGRSLNLGVENMDARFVLHGFFEDGEKWVKFANSIVLGFEEKDDHNVRW